MKWYEKTWVVVLFIIFIWPIGLIMMWCQKKFNTVARVIITALIIIIAIAGCGGKSDKATKTSTKATDKVSTTSSTEDTSSQNKKAEEEEKIKQMENKYEPILQSGKAYADMTNEEGDIANAIITNWDKLSDDFKTKYNDAKNVLSKSIDDYKAAKKAEAEEAKKAEEARKAAEEAASYDTGITYEQLARTPDDYKGQKVKFTGKVIQVIEGDKETDLRIELGGNYKTVLFAGYDPSITTTRVLEGDQVTIKGKSIGIYSYQSTMGGKISIPGVYVDSISIN